LEKKAFAAKKNKITSDFIVGNNPEEPYLYYYLSFFKFTSYIKPWPITYYRPAWRDLNKRGQDREEGTSLVGTGCPTRWGGGGAGNI
jgi:hypothetical protein